jgi:putative phosphoesterase
MTEPIGVISDTHGSAPMARRAIAALVARGARQIVHLGDVGSESVLDLMAGLDATVVFGNCDDERGLARYAEAIGIRVAHPACVIEVKHPCARITRIGMTHGHLEHEVDRLFRSEVDYLLHGHTHEVRDEMVGRTRVLNPGALHRARRYTALLLDPRSGSAEWIDVVYGETEGQPRPNRAP